MRLLAGTPPTSWPSVTTATVDEEPRPGRTPATYEQAVVPFIEGRSFELTPETREVVAEATAAMHRFDERMREHPFAGHVLRVLEAGASSQMEGLQTPAVHLGEALIGRTADPAALAIARNLAAAQVAEQTRGSDATVHALEVHRALMDPSDIAHTPGELRQQLVWIGAGWGGPSTAAFVPPAWTSVPALMDDLAAHTASIRTHDALAKAAVAHAQFETIHPFTDGNGRTGRALIHTVLRSAGQTRHVIVPISVGLRARQQAYIDALTAYRAGDVDPIVTVLAEATAEAIWRAEEVIDAFASLRASWGEHVGTRAHSGVHTLLDALLTRPVLDGRSAKALFETSTGSGTYRHLERLVDAGILTSSKPNGGGVQRWRADGLLDWYDWFQRRTNPSYWRGTRSADPAPPVTVPAWRR